MVYARYWSMEIFTFFKGKLVGRDALGNRYYQEKFLFKKPKTRRPRRWVMYPGLLEGSTVPPEWFGWLHHSLEAPLSLTQKKPWQKSWQPHLTGTSLAYSPQRTPLKCSSPKGYKPWIPS